jgi:hypothetical protein
MQPAIGELHLGLDPDGTRDAESLRVLGQISEERGLAHARLTAKHEGSALAGANVGQDSVKRIALRLPPQKSYVTLSPVEGAPSGATLYLLSATVSGSEY